jgi:hypothetical protein
MEKECKHYRQMISAYIDNRISDQDITDIEEHLEDCQACQAFFRRLLRLNQKAPDALENMDNNLLDQLEERIMSGIDLSDSKAESKKTEKIKIIPIWYRYVAAAASIVLVFLIGKIVYEDSIRYMYDSSEQSIDYRLPEDKKDVPEKAKSIADEGQPAAEQESLIDDDRATSVLQSRTESREKEDALLKPQQVTEGQQPQVIEETSVRAVKEGIEINQTGSVSTKTKEEIEITPVADVDELLSREAGFLQPGEQQTDRTENGAGSRAMQIDEHKIAKTKLGVPEPVLKGTSEVIESKKSDKQINSGFIRDSISSPTEIRTNDEAMKSADYFSAKDRPSNQIPEVKEESQRDVSSEYIDLLREKLEKKDNTLEYHYASMFLKGFDYQEKKGEYDPDEITDERYFKVAENIIIQIEAKLKITNPMLRIRNNYFAARASYDMYRFTGDEQHLITASQYRELALEDVYNEKERGNRSRFVTTFREELENWNFEH